jgi:hypothetical protein
VLGHAPIRCSPTRRAVSVKASPDLAANDGAERQPVVCIDRVSPVCVLVVKDSLPFRQYINSIRSRTGDLQVVRETSEGSEAFRKDEQLQPELILFDIGLLSRDGLEAARQSQAAAKKISTLNEARPVLYGLPCADCHAYYDANVTECPVCRSTHRITPSKPFGSNLKRT